MNIKAFFDHDTSTLTYVVSDPATKEAAIIDPVLDYDPMASRVTKDSLKTVIQYKTSLCFRDARPRRSPLELTIF